jgi:hypothetical protein
MIRINRREFFRMGAGLIGAAVVTKCAVPLFSSQDATEWVPPESAAVRYTSGVLLVNGVRAEIGTVLNRRDRLQTGDRSEAEIEIQDYAIFHMKENSIVEIDDIFLTAHVTVRKGWFLAVVRKKKEFSLSTPMVTAGVRGTVLFVNVLNDERMYLCDCNGTVDLTDTTNGRFLKSVTSEYHTAFDLTRMQNGVALTGAGLRYHHDDDILKMARRFSEETEVFKRKKGGGYE